MVRQIDNGMQMLELADGITVKDFGCLTVAIFNILLKHKRVKNDFNAFLTDIKKNGGYTKNGLLKWDAVKLCCGMSHRILPIGEAMKADDAYEYVVQIPYKDTGHFCEVLYVSKSGLIIYRDSYDGELRETRRAACLSIRELKLL